MDQNGYWWGLRAMLLEIRYVKGLSRRHESGWEETDKLHGHGGPLGSHPPPCSTDQGGEPTVGSVSLPVDPDINLIYTVQGNEAAATLLDTSEWPSSDDHEGQTRETPGRTWSSGRKAGKKWEAQERGRVRRRGLRHCMVPPMRKKRQNLCMTRWKKGLEMLDF